MSRVIYGDEFDFDEKFKEREDDSPEVKEVKKLMRESKKKIDKELKEILTKPKDDDFKYCYIGEHGEIVFTEECMRVLGECSKLIK